MIRFLLILVLLFSSMALSIAVEKTKSSAHFYSPFTGTLREKSFQVANETDYFIEDTAQTGDSFVRLQNETSVGYGLTDDLMIFLGGRLRQNTSSYSASNHVVHDVNVSGLESYFAGVKYALPKMDRWTYAIEVSFRQTTFTNNPYNKADPYSDMVLGDEGIWLRGGVHMVYSTRGHDHFETQLFYNGPSRLSSELEYNVRGTLTADWLAASLGVKGVYSLGTDEYTDHTSDKPLMQIGATRFYNSINRSYNAPYAALRFPLGDRFQIDGSAALFRATHSAPDGVEYMMTLTYTGKGVAPKAKVVERFKEYNIEASVIKVSPRGIFVQIDKGIADEVEKGMKMDIYENDYLGGNVLIASGTVYEAIGDKAVIKIEKSYSDRPLKTGLVARGVHN